MRRFTLMLAAASLALPVAVAVPTDQVQARKHRYYARDNRRVCRHSAGTTGLVAGGVGGAVVGNALGGGLLGTAAGAVGGALGGRAVDRSVTAKRRCR